VTTPFTADSALGWYVYGVTRRGALPPVPTEDGLASLRLFEFSQLAAIVRPVPLEAFSAEALRSRLQDPADLEEMVRSHNRVVEAIHSRQSILPAKFGWVHSQAEDLVAALASAHDTFLQQLHRLDGCDEWSVHLYADRRVIRERLASDDAIRRLRASAATARPGRAYFLEQRIREMLDAATERSLSDIAQTVSDRLLLHAVDGDVSPIAYTAGPDEVEILSSSFLVGRDRGEHFQEAVRASADASEGLRCEFSGPWPPYTFAGGSE